MSKAIKRIDEGPATGTVTVGDVNEWVWCQFCGELHYREKFQGQTWLLGNEEMAKEDGVNTDTIAWMNTCEEL